MKNIQKIQIFLYSFFFLSAFVQGAKVNIADFLKKEKKLTWTKSAACFQKNNGSFRLYRWNSSQKQSLHYAANRKKGIIYFLDWQVVEADFYFKNRQLNKMSLNLYNKSCPSNSQLAKNKNTFLDFLNSLRQSLNSFSQIKHSKIITKLIGGARCQSCTWSSPSACIVAKWSYAGSSQNSFVAHYVTLTIYKDKQSFEETSSSKTPLTDEELKARVQTNKAGDRYITIPMVDQGKRGYCVVACAERILKYYNINIDQHVLAQVANTSNRGTRICST